MNWLYLIIGTIVSLLGIAMIFSLVYTQTPEGKRVMTWWTCFVGAGFLVTGIALLLLAVKPI